MKTVYSVGISIFINSCLYIYVFNILKGVSPMPFTVQLPTYQVETKSGSTLYPSHKEAQNHYQKFVDNKVPCELYEDGKLQKEYKP
tara:strand:- start:31 stop:288 length:258 start_codon:yes stop_codon:yes gene_type:complete